jgi:hypothetical protein
MYTIGNTSFEIVEGMLGVSNVTVLMRIKKKAEQQPEPEVPCFLLHLGKHVEYTPFLQE